MSASAEMVMNGAGNGDCGDATDGHLLGLLKGLAMCNSFRMLMSDRPMLNFMAGEFSN